MCSFDAAEKNACVLFGTDTFVDSFFRGVECAHFLTTGLHGSFRTRERATVTTRTSAAGTKRFHSRIASRLLARQHCDVFD